MPGHRLLGDFLPRYFIAKSDGQWITLIDLKGMIGGNELCMLREPPAIYNGILGHEEDGLTSENAHFWDHDLCISIDGLGPTGSPRVDRPEDVAALVAYLGSGEAVFVTGQNFIVAGGMTEDMIYAE